VDKNLLIGLYESIRYASTHPEKQQAWVLQTLATEADALGMRAEAAALRCAIEAKVMAAPRLSEREYQGMWGKTNEALNEQIEPLGWAFDPALPGWRHGPTGWLMRRISAGVLRVETDRWHKSVLSGKRRPDAIAKDLAFQLAELMRKEGRHVEL
jgi:hypothetical protein